MHVIQATSKPRIKTNFLCQMFVYAESLVFKTVKKKLPGYCALHHFAKPNSCRRGITVFFQEKFQFSISKDRGSDSFDILWIRLQSVSEAFIFCFFYAPGDHKPIGDRTKFYDELREGLKRYPPGTKIFLLGDSNARLGAFSKDKGIMVHLSPTITNRCFEGFLSIQVCHT